MTDMRYPYSPLAIFPETTFELFYSNLSKRLGFMPPARIGALEPAAWREMRSLIEKGDYVGVARMADGRDPNSSLNDIVLTIDGLQGGLSFGKILGGKQPIAIALNPIGGLANGSTTKIPSEVIRGSVLKTVRFEPLQWLGLAETAKKYGLEQAVENDWNSYSTTSLAFLNVLDGVFAQLKGHFPNEYKRIFEKKKLIIGDIGCGRMTYYGTMLAWHFLRHDKEVSVAGIDPAIPKNSTLGISPPSLFVPIRCDLAEAAVPLNEQGIHSFDLLTMFNPRDIIDIGDLPQSFRESSLILTALDDDYGYPQLETNHRGASREDVLRNLVDNGYMVLTENLNPHAELLDNSGFKFNPIIVAQRLSALLRRPLSS